ncbi:site-specific integrase [Vreelandella titanicae]|uniref:site-specific integrase n=1 Tax=Vreelandella titanicae TaxID=664683 RepID=UPI0016815C05|nr:site-specific integrase [Halomonas titanicae]QNU61665.1 site-specific integrase [Halomonas titanicae]
MSSPYLLKSRHGIYYFRLVIPVPLRVVIGKTELRRSLKTRSKREALLKSARLLLEAQELLGSAEGRETGSDPTPAFTGAPRPPSDTTLSAPVPTLSQFFESYRQFQLVQGVSLKTLDDKEAVVHLLLLICQDKRVDYYTIGDAKLFREKALQLPPLALRTLQKHPNKVLSDLIGRGESAISITTYNNYIKSLSTIFSYAQKEGILKSNPFANMRIKNPMRVSSYRDVFTPSEVALIFKKTSHYRESKQSFKYWLPRLAYYTGARLNELCQLCKQDIKLINDVPCIHIQAVSPNQRIKNSSSERVIPLHSKLVEFGFNEWVENQDNQIFPMLRYSDKHGYSATPSRWFGRFKADLGLFEDGAGKKDFHSFRHTVADELKQKGVSENLIGGILGHTTGGITNTRYGKDFKPEVLKPVIELLAH